MSGRALGSTRRGSGVRAASLLLLVVTALLAVTTGRAGADHEGPEVVTVNGRPFHGEGSPKLEGCDLTIAVSELIDAEHEISVEIAFTDPSGDAVLVDDDAVFTGTAWDATYPMTDLVAGVEPHANGYHVVITVVLDGAPQTSRPFWLLCGATDEGNPFRIFFLKQWQTTDGEVLSALPPTLDRSAFAIDVTSDRGTAHCVYPQAGDELACTYVNGRGHEDETEVLIVPAGERFTFTVTETGLPEGWAPLAGVGTFSPREVCPFDDHEEGVGVAAAQQEEGRREPCGFTVVNQGDLPAESTTTTAPSTTTTEPPTSQSPTTPPTSAGAEVAPNQLAVTSTSTPGSLPATGVGGARAMVLVGLVALASGFGLLLWTQRRRALS